MAFLSGGDIKLKDPLRNPLSAIGGKRQSALQDAIGRITGGVRTSQAASGVPQGDYIGQEIGRASDTASRGIDDSLLGVIGNASYKDTLSERDFQRKAALAKELGDMASPSTLQEIIGGIGSLGPIIPAIGSMYRSRGGSLPQNLSLFSGSGLSRYS